MQFILNKHPRVSCKYLIHSELPQILLMNVFSYIVVILVMCCMSIFTSFPVHLKMEILMALKMAARFSHLYRNRCCPALLAPYVYTTTSQLTELFPSFLLSRIPRNKTAGHLLPTTVCLLSLPPAPAPPFICAFACCCN